MSFVGVDPTLQATGLFAFEPGEWYKSQVVRPKKLYGVERLLWIKNEVRIFLDSLPSVSYGAIENGSFGSVGRLYQLGGVQAILQLELWDTVDYGFAEVAPVQLKKFQTGKSGAIKKWMLDAANDFIAESVNPGVADILRTCDWPALKVEDDNIADALGLARVAHALWTEEVRTRGEAEVVHSLQNSKHIYTRN